MSAGGDTGFVEFTGIGWLAIQPVSPRLWREIKDAPDSIPVPKLPRRKQNPQNFRWETVYEPCPDNPEYQVKVATAKRQQKIDLWQHGSGLVDPDFSRIFELLPLAIIRQVVEAVISLTLANDPYTQAVSLFNDRLEKFPQLQKFVSSKRSSANSIKPPASDPHFEEAEARRFHNYTVTEWEAEPVMVRAELICAFWEKNIRESYVEAKKAELLERQTKNRR